MENKGEREGRSKQPGAGYCGENSRERSGEGEQREKKRSPGEGSGRRAPWLSIPITHSPCCFNSQRWGCLYSQDSRP